MSSPDKSLKVFDPKEYWESRLSENFELKGVGYSLLGRGYNEWMYKVRRRVFLREAKALRRNWSATNVLDIGSGTGFYLRLWQELGVANITGADLTSVAVNKLRECFRDRRILQLDIGDDLAEGVGQFDAVSIFDVLFHIVDDRRYETAVRNLACLVVPGGHLVMSDNFVHGVQIRSEHHVSRTRAYIEETLVRHGFEIVRRVPMFVLMNEPVDTTSRLRRLGWKVFLRCVSYSELAGFLVGAALYPLDLLLTRVKSESATTELMICRRHL